MERRFFCHCTSIIYSKNSDAIMVMDHGKIIERGNHETLINQKGVYYQLYTGVFEIE